MPIIENIPAIYAGTHDVTVYLGNVQVWPANLTYVVSDVRVSYSTGDKLNAAGSNYAQILGTVTTYRGSTVISIIPSVVLTPTRVSGSTYLHVSGNRIVADNRGQTVGNQRSAYFTASYMTSGPSAQVQVTQEANSQGATTHDYFLTVEIQHTGNLPGTGDNYTVAYSSYVADVLHYTSGDYPQEHVPIVSSILGTNCTPSVSSVSGTGTFTIAVTANPSGSRFVIVSIANGGYTGQDTRIQNPLAAVEATFTPAVGVRDGKVSIRMNVTSGTPVGATLLTNVVFHYTDRGSSYSFAVDDITIIDGETQPITDRVQVALMGGSQGQCWIEALANNITEPTYATINYYVAEPI